MSAIFEPPLRIIDVAATWILLSEDPKIIRNRVSIHTLLFVLVMLIDFGKIIYLSSKNQLEYATAVVSVIHITMYAIVLAIVVINETSRVNIINSARQVNAAWLSFVLLYTPMLEIYGSMFSGKRARQTVRSTVVEVSRPTGAEYVSE